jgi:hypothetical protein
MPSLKALAYGNNVWFGFFEVRPAARWSTLGRGGAGGGSRRPASAPTEKPTWPRGQQGVTEGYSFRTCATADLQANLTSLLKVRACRRGAAAGRRGPGNT